MASFDYVVATMSERVSTLSSFGKKIKFSVDGSVFIIDGTLTPPSVSVADGKADTTILVSLEVFLKLLDKKMSPMLAFTTGKIRMSGDLKGATALQKII